MPDRRAERCGIFLVIHHQKAFEGREEPAFGWPQSFTLELLHSNEHSNPLDGWKDTYSSVRHRLAHNQSSNSQRRCQKYSTHWTMLEVMLRVDGGGGHGWLVAGPI